MRLLSALDAWQAMLRELDDIEMRTAAAALRLPAGDPDIDDLWRSIAVRRAVIIDACARLREAAGLLAPDATLH